MGLSAKYVVCHRSHGQCIDWTAAAAAVTIRNFSSIFSRMKSAIQLRMAATETKMRTSKNKYKCALDGNLATYILSDNLKYGNSPQHSTDSQRQTLA